MRRAQLIRKLVLDSHYVIDEHLVASAILARATARGLIGGVAFRNDPPPPAAVRSFRPSSHARSFRPCTIRAFDRRRVAAHLGLL
ncbi:MAG TPA: hypothetical protein VN672_11470 [Solirubrobacteraceae bacterium]|nr:hypothetical protein [Solirubrobacteraceae bacterium]